MQGMWEVSSMGDIKMIIKEDARDGGNFHVKFHVEGMKEDVKKAMRMYLNV